MTRLGQWGAELGHIHAEGLILTGTGTASHDTGVKRTGTRSYKFDSGAGNASVSYQASFTGTTGVTYYAVMHVLIPTASGLPSAANTQLFQWGNVGSTVSVRITSGGKIGLYVGGTQIGSDSAETIAANDSTWHRLEATMNINAAGGADDTIACYLNGTLVASTTTATVGTAGPVGFYIGWSTAPGANRVVYIDDVALNSSDGSVNNGLVGDQKIYASLPVSSNARVNWTDGAGGTANIFGSVDNIPPRGVSTSTSGAADQIENPTSGVASYDANMTDYTTLGIGSGDTITAVQTVIEAGSSSTTGSDTITHEMVSNPAVAANGTNSVDIVAGTYPTNWNRGVGTITENPSVTKGTQPVMRVTKTASVTRIHTVCLMALVVAVSPGAPPSGATRYGSIMMVG